LQNHFCLVLLFNYLFYLPLSICCVAKTSSIALLMCDELPVATLQFFYINLCFVYCIYLLLHARFVRPLYVCCMPKPLLFGTVVDESYCNCMQLFL